MFVIISVSETDVSCDISLDAAFVSDDHCCSVFDTCHFFKVFLSRGTVFYGSLLRHRGTICTPFVFTSGMRCQHCIIVFVVNHAFLWPSSARALSLSLRVDTGRGDKCLPFFFFFFFLLNVASAVCRVVDPS